MYFKSDIVTEKQSLKLWLWFSFLTLATNCLALVKSLFNYEPQSLHLENDALKISEFCPGWRGSVD